MPGKSKDQDKAQPDLSTRSSQGSPSPILLRILSASAHRASDTAVTRYSSRLRASVHGRLSTKHGRQELTSACDVVSQLEDVVPVLQRQYVRLGLSVTWT